MDDFEGPLNCAEIAKQLRELAEAIETREDVCPAEDSFLLKEAATIIESLVRSREYDYFKWEHRIEGEVKYTRQSLHSPYPFHERWAVTRITQEEYEAAMKENE